jgi:hypothetical protein
MHLASLETSRHVKIGALFFNLKRIEEKKNIEVQVPEDRGHQRTHQNQSTSTSHISPGPLFISIIHSCKLSVHSIFGSFNIPT